MTAFVHQNHAELEHRKTEPSYFSPVTKESQILCTSVGFYLSPYNHITSKLPSERRLQQKKRGGQNPAHSLRHLSVNISKNIHLISSMERLEIPGKVQFLHVGVWYHFICPNLSHWLPAPVAVYVGPLYVLYHICQLCKSFWDFLKCHLSLCN